MKAAGSKAEKEAQASTSTTSSLILPRNGFSNHLPLNADIAGKRHRFGSCRFKDTLVQYDSGGGGIREEEKLKGSSL